MECCSLAAFGELLFENYFLFRVWYVKRQRLGRSKWDLRLVRDAHYMDARVAVFMLFNSEDKQVDIKVRLIFTGRY